MSHHSEEMLNASSDSFWEPGNFKRTTKRIEDGHSLCNDLIKLVNERAEIEKTYARNLKTWSKKWAEAIEKGPEYGTTEAACKGVLVEADCICDLHSTIKEDLHNDVITQIRNWQKENYHKNVMHLKERKEMEDLFKKAQKPWAKLLQKVNKCRADYHNACKNEKSALNQERNATSDSSLSPDQLRKMQDRVNRSKEEVQRCREKYEAALQEITTYNPKYIEDMREVFDKCQEMEAKRLTFFKEAMFSIHKCINISEKPGLPKIYEEFHHTISNADHLKDLKWWSNNHGVNMAMNWPTFEDYSEEFRDITKSKIKESVPTGITLITQKSVSDDSPAGGNLDSKGNSMRKANGNNELMKTSLTKASKKEEEIKANSNGSGKEKNPFEDEEWEEGSNSDGALVDRGEPGVLVRALYDYDGAEDDELTFKQGEQFEKLEDEDEQEAGRNMRRPPLEPRPVARKFNGSMSYKIYGSPVQGRQPTRCATPKRRGFRPPSRKPAYSQYHPIRRSHLQPRRVEETDSEFSSSEPEWSKGPFAGEFPMTSELDTKETILFIPQNEVTTRTKTRCLGPAPFPCLDPIPSLSLKIEQASLGERPGTYVIKRPAYSSNSKFQPIKSRSDESANNRSNILYDLDDFPSDNENSDDENPNHGHGDHVKSNNGKSDYGKWNHGKGDNENITKVEEDMKVDIGKERRGSKFYGCPGTYRARRGKVFLPPSALLRSVKAKQIHQDNCHYKERIRNAKPSKEIANAFRRELGSES